MFESGQTTSTVPTLQVKTKSWLNRDQRILMCNWWTKLGGGHDQSKHPLSATATLGTKFIKILGNLYMMIHLLKIVIFHSYFPYIYMCVYIYIYIWDIYGIYIWDIYGIYIYILYVAGLHRFFITSYSVQVSGMFGSQKKKVQVWSPKFSMFTGRSVVGRWSGYWIKSMTYMCSECSSLLNLAI